MKRFIALLLLASMALSACTSSADGGSSDTSNDAADTTSAATPTTAEPTIPTDSMPETIFVTDQPITVPITDGPQSVTTEETPTPSLTDGTTAAVSTTSAETPVTNFPVTSSTEKPMTDVKPVITTPKPTTTTVKPTTTTVKPTTTTVKPTTTTTKPSVTTTKPVTTTKTPVTISKPTTQKTPTRETVTVATLGMETLFPIDNASRVTLISSTAGGFNEKETAVSLFDSVSNTKLCTANTEYTIVWKLDKAAHIYGYSLMNGNDSSSIERRPTAWTLEASTDGSNWTTVSTVTNANLVKHNYAEKFFALDVAGSYQYFRFQLNAQVSDQTQLAEITLFTDEIPYTPAYENKLNESLLDDSANLTAGLDLVKRTIGDYHNFEYNTVGEQPGDTGATTLWPATSLLEAVAEAYRICPDDPYIYSTYVDLLNHVLGTYRVEGTIYTPNRGSFDVVYYNASANNSGDYYYDDDAWVCIQFLVAYELLGDERYLEMAEESLEFFWTGWDDELGGGIYWDKSYQSKNTCANGPIAIAYLRAFEYTGKIDYLKKAQMIYEWLRDVMLQNNLYCDNISTDGSMNTWKAAYNQGTPLCVGAMLYRITGEQRYLTETTAVWNATINHMFRGSGSDTTMNGNPIYKAWCVGWLVRGFEMYYTVDPSKQTTAMDKMLSVLEDERGTINYQGNTGYYDPYFLTGEYASESMTQILQPSGVATTFLLAGLYEIMN